MLRVYMKDDITVLYSEGEGDYGEPATTTDVEMKAYIVWGTHLINKISGAQVIASPLISIGIVYVMPERLIGHADRIKINGIEHVVLNTMAGKDFSENHQEIHIQ